MIRGAARQSPSLSAVRWSRTNGRRASSRARGGTNLAWCLLPLPSSRFYNGWIHVLEDSELALLLMISGLHARFGYDRQVYLDGDTRLLQFGIGR